MARPTVRPGDNFCELRYWQIHDLPGFNDLRITWSPEYNNLYNAWLKSSEGAIEYATYLRREKNIVPISLNDTPYYFRRARGNIIYAGTMRTACELRHLFLTDKKEYERRVKLIATYETDEKLIKDQIAVFATLRETYRPMNPQEIAEIDQESLCYGNYLLSLGLQRHTGATEQMRPPGYENEPPQYDALPAPAAASSPQHDIQPARDLPHYTRENLKRPGFFEKLLSKPAADEPPAYNQLLTGNVAVTGSIPLTQRIDEHNLRPQHVINFLNYACSHMHTDREETANGDFSLLRYDMRDGEKSRRKLHLYAPDGMVYKLKANLNDQVEYKVKLNPLGESHKIELFPKHLTLKDNVYRRGVLDVMDKMAQMLKIDLQEAMRISERRNEPSLT